VAAGLERGVKTILWLAIPVISLGVLAFVPAAQAWFWTRSKAWLVIALTLLLGGAAIVVLAAIDTSDTAGAGFVAIGSMAGGLVSALFARPVAFGQVDRRPGPGGFTMDEHRDPAVRSLVHRRHRRKVARRLIERDPQFATELGVGRPDDRFKRYDDGGLVDLNNVGADGLVTALRWPRDQAEAFVRERDLRRGYDSLAEIGAFSSVDPVLLDHQADRLVVLPWQPR
jgi:hypothetical protein